jgi:hypothetical protein
MLLLLGEHTLPLWAIPPSPEAAPPPSIMSLLVRHQPFRRPIILVSYLRLTLCPDGIPDEYVQSSRPTWVHS